MAKTRLHVPMTDETRANLQAYADAAGIPLSRAAGQILDEVSPVMVDLASALAQAKTAPARAMRNISEVVEQKLAEIDQLKLDMSPKATRKKAS